MTEQGWEKTVAETQSLMSQDIRVFSCAETNIIDGIKKKQAKLSYEAGHKAALSHLDCKACATREHSEGYEEGKKAGMRLVHDTLEGNSPAKPQPVSEQELREQIAQKVAEIRGMNSFMSGIPKECYRQADSILSIVGAYYKQAGWKSPEETHFKEMDVIVTDEEV